MERIHDELSKPVAAPAKEVASRQVPEVARALALQREIGNRATARQLARAPKAVAVGGEKVMVENDAEEAEAKKLVEGMKTKYGVEVSSAQAVKSTLATYKDAPQAERDKVKARPWLLSELKSLDKALAHFSPILGGSRATSTRKDVAQEVTTAGKASYSIDENTDKGKIDSTLGQYYGSDKNFALYAKNETSTIDFPGDKAKQQEATAVHEIAHGLMDYALDGFIKASPYWTNRTTKSGAKDAEAPPTPYGAKNAGEDLAESVMFYFVDRKRLEDGMTGKKKGEPGNGCPERCAYLRKVIDGWKPVVKAEAAPPPADRITDESMVLV